MGRRHRRLHPGPARHVPQHGGGLEAPPGPPVAPAPRGLSAHDDRPAERGQARRGRR
jgi:hypothetical protein